MNTLTNNTQHEPTARTSSVSESLLVNVTHNSLYNFFCAIY